MMFKNDLWKVFTLNILSSMFTLLNLFLIEIKIVTNIRYKTNCDSDTSYTRITRNKALDQLNQELINIINFKFITLKVLDCLTLFK